MKHSDNIADLAASLVKAQPYIKDALKGSMNPHIGSKYASLPEVIDACRLPLADQGLAVVFTGDWHDGRVFMTTTLVHVSGQWLSGEMPMEIAPHKGINILQALGSAVTYARRYGLSSIANIATEDDDGHASGPRGGGQQASGHRGGYDEQRSPDYDSDPIPNDAPNPKFLAETAESLRKCKDLDQLQVYWKNMTKEFRLALADVKNEVKAKLLGRDADKEKV